MVLLQLQGLKRSSLEVCASTSQRGISGCSFSGEAMLREGAFSDTAVLGYAWFGMACCYSIARHEVRILEQYLGFGSATQEGRICKQLKHHPLHLANAGQLSFPRCLSSVRKRWDCEGFKC